MIEERVALVHARLALQLSTGSLASRHEARLSLNLVPAGEDWDITFSYKTLAITD